MSSRFGICRNQDYCSLALQRTVLRLAPDELFVCPECARPLSQASAWKKGGAGHITLLRLAPPLGIVAVGVGAIWLGLKHPDAPPPARPVAAASARAEAPVPAAHALAPQARVAVPEPRKVPRLAAVPVKLQTVVLLRLGAAPPLNQKLLPQLAAGYLAAAFHGLPVLGAVDDVGHAVLTTGGRIVDIQVVAASFDAAAFASGQTDVLCTQDEPIAAQLQAAGALVQQAIGDMPPPAADAIICYGKPGGDAAAFMGFLGSPSGRQIAASAGYDFQKVPQPPPPAPPAAPTPAPSPTPATFQAAPPVLAARPAAKALASAAPAAKAVVKPAPKPGASKLAMAQPHGTKAAGSKAARAKPAAAKPAAQAPIDDTNADQTPAPSASGAATQATGPRRIVVPPGSPLTLEALKALTGSPAPPAKDADGAAPHPRVIYLPASARLSFGTFHPLNMPTQPPRLVFVRPEAANRPGSLKVDCKIGTDGIPSDCREIAHEGTQEAAAAIMAWLPSGGIRYTPAVKDGHSVAERRVITVTFGGKGGAKAAQ